MIAVDVDCSACPNGCDIIDMPYQHAGTGLARIPCFVGPILKEEHFVWVFGIGNAVGDVAVNFIQSHRPFGVKFFGRSHPSNG